MTIPKVGGQIAVLANNIHDVRRVLGERRLPPCLRRRLHQSFSPSCSGGGLIASGPVVAPGTANATVKVETDSEVWSTTTTVDDGTLTGFSIVGNRVRLATASSDTIVSEKVGGNVQVKLNGVLQDELALQTDLQRVWYNAPVFNIAIVPGVSCTWTFEGFPGYAEAGGSNTEYRFRYRVENKVTHGSWFDHEEAVAVGQPGHFIKEPHTDYVAVTFSLVVAEIWTPDGWVRAVSDLPWDRTCPA